MDGLILSNRHKIVKAIIPTAGVKGEVKVDQWGGRITRAEEGWEIGD
jgi:hypothetical protein